MAYLKFGDTEIAVPTTFTIDKKKIMSDNAGLRLPADMWAM